MGRIFFGFMIFFGFFTTAHSQHCAWDNSFIIIVEVRDSLTNEIINELDIILTDSVGNPYTSEWNLRNTSHSETSFSEKSDTLKFGQNQKLKTKNSSNPYPVQIPFGIGYYMLQVYYNNYPHFNENGTDKILIRDKNGQYKSISIAFKNYNIAHMCTNNGFWHYEEELDKVKIEVKLNRRN